MRSVIVFVARRVEAALNILCGYLLRGRGEELHQAEGKNDR
ncbi:MAG TPA: hypothetical protein VJ441_04145 [Dehalococcoidia bacterium]|nr:hypothetical protein [Dehalococcoidia bacterium]